MKIIHSLRLITFGLAMTFVFLLPSCNSSRKLVKVGPEDVSKMIQDESFVFIAQKMNPQRGIPKDLSAYYDVHVTKTDFNSFLPFLGRLYAPVVDPWNAGLRFNSTNFSYQWKLSGKDNWEVTITPKDVTDISFYHFTIFGNGNASLFITSNNKSNISFDGYLQPEPAETENEPENG